MKLADFVCHYLREKITYWFAPFHYELIELTRKERVAIAAPRGFAKSSYFSFFYPLYASLNQGPKRIIIISATETFACDWLRKIKIELETNPFLLEDYGDQQSEKWTESHIILKNGSEIWAKGAGCQIRGYHPDILVADDLETDEGVRSPEQREKLSEWFWRALINTLDRNCQLIVIGTILHSEGLLANLISQPRPGWITRLYRALENNESLWPAKLSLAALMTKREEIGTYRFESEFQNNPLGSDDVIIRPEWIKPYDKLPKIAFKATALDPAITKKDVGCNTGMVTVGVGYDNCYYVLESLCGKWSFHETLTELESSWRRHKADFVGIETVAYQKALADELSRRNPDIPVLSLRADQDKRRRAISVSHLFEQGRVYLNNEDLKQELISFPNGKSIDMADALIHALMLILKYSEDHYEKKSDPLKKLDSRSQLFWKGFLEEKERLEKGTGFVDDYGLLGEEVLYTDRQFVDELF